MSGCHWGPRLSFTQGVRHESWWRCHGGDASPLAARLPSRLVSSAAASTAPFRAGLLGLGSNVGERRAHLQAAVEALPAAGVEVLASSSVYDTDPVGEVLKQASFFNACLRVRTALAPLELLDAVKLLEGELGRGADGEEYVRHGPRTIDIDVLLLGDLEFRHERMVLPHPQVLARRFVLVPALELDLDLAVPDGRRLADALLRLPLSEGVRWAGPPLQVTCSAQ
jgi:2-amino-4-hydroxy-6-hydroxymethyldihydropteridine diphosphokinase